MGDRDVDDGKNLCNQGADPSRGKPLRKEQQDKESVTRADVEAAATRLLARRGHAREELKRKLRRRGFEESMISQVLDHFVERGIVDDRRFADEQAAILVRKCWGPVQIRKKLRARGVDDRFIDEALDEFDAPAIWRDHARQRLQARFGAAAELDERDQRRAYRHLRYRGFRPAMIRRLLFD